MYTYTVTDNKLIYVQDYNLYTCDLDGKNKTPLLGKTDNKAFLFGIAGDWIVLKSSTNVTIGETTLIKLDGTKPSVKF